MSGRLYLTVSDILLLQETLIQKFGGEAGLLDPALLSSAVGRPQSGYYEGLVEEGCALFQSLWLNHAFLDGNKRVAIAALDLFFRINGFCLTLHDQTSKDSILGLHENVVRDFSALVSLFSNLTTKLIK